MRVVGIHRVFIPSIILTYDASLRYLAEAGKLEYKSISLKQVTSRILNWGDVFFFGRSDTKLELKIAKLLLKNGKHNLIYVLDDDLLNVPDLSNCSQFYNSTYVKSVISEMLDICPILASPSKKILEKYGQGKRNILLEEPALMQTRLQSSDSKIIKIGYAGSLDHQSDVDIVIRETLQRLKSKYSDRIQIEFFGAKPSGENVIDSTYLPYEKGYLNYLTKLSERKWDIGLIPLIDCEFNSYKHYIKAIEYTSLGIIPIASDVYVYHRFYERFGEIELEKNDVNLWVDLISYYIDNPDIIPQKKQRCIELSKHFFIDETSQGLFQALNTMPILQDTKTKCINIKIPFFIQYYIARLDQVIRVNGVIMCIKKLINNALKNFKIYY